MASYNDTLAALMMDVSIDGAAVIEKRKLLWLMGKSHDRPSAWAKLVDFWEDMGGERDELFGLEVHNKIVLVKGPGPEMMKVLDWAQTD